MEAHRGQVTYQQNLAFKWVFQAPGYTCQSPPPMHWLCGDLLGAFASSPSWCLFSSCPSVLWKPTHSCLVGVRPFPHLFFASPLVTHGDPRGSSALQIYFLWWTAFYLYLEMRMIHIETWISNCFGRTRSMFPLDKCRLSWGDGAQVLQVTASSPLPLGSPLWPRHHSPRSPAGALGICWAQILSQAKWPRASL